MSVLICFVQLIVLVVGGVILKLLWMVSNVQNVNVSINRILVSVALAPWCWTGSISKTPPLSSTWTWKGSLMIWSLCLWMTLKHGTPQAGVGPLVYSVSSSSYCFVFAPHSGRKIEEGRDKGRDANIGGHGGGRGTLHLLMAKEDGGGQSPDPKDGETDLHQKGGEIDLQ